MTLTDYRAELRIQLRDAGSAVWSDGQLDAAVRLALEQYSRVAPRWVWGTVALGSTTREISVSALTSLIEVREVWLPYTAASPEWPPNRREFDFWPWASVVYLADGYEGSSGEVARVGYWAGHTINGLDSATASTARAWHERAIAEGAAALAAQARDRQITEAENVSGGTRVRSHTWVREAIDRWEKFLASLAAGESGMVEWGLSEVERLEF